MTFDPQREEKTLQQCRDVLNALDDLETALARGPRLTRREEDFRLNGLARIRATYDDIEKHCRANLKG